MLHYLFAFSAWFSLRVSATGLVHVSCVVRHTIITAPIDLCWPATHGESSVNLATGFIFLSLGNCVSEIHYAATEGKSECRGGVLATEPFPDQGCLCGERVPDPPSSGLALGRGFGPTHL